MEAQAYLDFVKERLLFCPKIVSVEIVDQKTSLQTQGYFRARLRLGNGSFAEISEYFTIHSGLYRPLKYRYQWMDGSQTRLIKRWDNVPHFPHIASFPHHVHIGSETNVMASKPLSIIDFIDIIEREIDR
jgi:hypothetical protein